MLPKPFHQEPMTHISMNQAAVKHRITNHPLPLHLLHQLCHLTDSPL
uniref:Uncharacterized protein n=1 Tax=Arundo donax TaxID=35708 RepID=A0A0A9GXN3_ARUDO